MKLGQLLGYYVVWHYGVAWLDIVRIWRNFLWFFYNFFSIPLLFKTLLSPFERLREDYGRDFEPGQFIAALVVNVIMRLIGAALRLFIIAVGIIVLGATFVGGIAFFLLWVILPVLVPLFFFWGATLMLL